MLGVPFSEIMEARKISLPEPSEPKIGKKRLPKFRGSASATSQIFLPELKAGGKTDFAINLSSRGSWGNLGIDLRQLRRRNLSRREAALVKPFLGYCPKKNGFLCPLAKSYPMTEIA